MAKRILDSPNAVAETLLIALHARVLEAQRPAPLIRDERAAALAAQVEYAASRATLSDLDQTTTIMRLRQFDRRVGDFLARIPRATVVHIGCGLDTRFDRVDNGRVRWFDLDLPEVIGLRRQLIRETARCRMIACSALEPAWMDQLGTPSGDACMFVAEGVFPYLEPGQVRWLVQTLHRSFPGSEIVFDALTPGMIRLHQIELRRMKIGARLVWGLRHPKDVEHWAEGIRLLQAWYYFDQPEPRLGVMQLMRYLPFFSRGVGVFHYKL